MLYRRNALNKFYNIANDKPSKDDIYFQEKFPNLKDSFNKAKSFLDKCLKGILINDLTNITIESPKISAIINFHNSQKTISRAVKSIQNQNISNIEIILVNDFSIDKSLEIVEEIQKKDKRIKIINNKKNMGTLYSRSIGALSSKGVYIFHLDSDDMFLDKDVFSIVMNIAEKGCFDIVSFKCIFSSYGKNILTNPIRDNYLNFHYDNKVLFQPELGLYPVRPGKQLGDYKVKENFIWSKCIKTKVYQTTLIKIGKERYSRYMIFEEDRTVLYALFNTAESIKFIGKYGILQIRTRGSVTRSHKKYSQRFRCMLLFADIVIDFNKETFESRKLLVYIITFLIKNPALKIISKSNYYKELFISCVNRVLNYKYISDQYKEEIRKRVLKLNFIKYKF